MDLTVNLAPSYRDLKDPTTRQNFDDTVEQKRVIDLRACHIYLNFTHMIHFYKNTIIGWDKLAMDDRLERKIVDCRMPMHIYTHIYIYVNVRLEISLTATFFIQ